QGQAGPAHRARGGGDDAALDEGHPRLGEARDHLLPVGREHRPGGVDLRHAQRLPGGEPGEHVLALAHQEDSARPRGRRRAHVLRHLEVDREAASLQVLRGQPEDLGVVALPARRVGLLAVDAPAVGVAHSIPPAGPTAPARARASASATSSARSTSTTVEITSPYSGWSRSASQVRYSRSRPRWPGGTSRRPRSGTRYSPAVTKAPTPPPMARTRPSPSRSTQSGFPGATRGVTPSTVASGGRAAAASAKRAKSAGRHHASTVETRMRPLAALVTSPKLSRDDAVVFTMKSMARRGKRRRTPATQSPPRSLTMMTTREIPPAPQVETTHSLRGPPATRTTGFPP